MTTRGVSQAAGIEPLSLPRRFCASCPLEPAATAIHFGQRVLFHEEEHPGAREVVVEVELNGRRAYLDKAKYESSTQLGVERCRNGYYIDRIREL
jgi:hypothetical protein